MNAPLQSPPPGNPAILLLGPTGSGKTPLGELLAQRGLHGRPCRHFDFGAEMRRLVQLDAPDALLAREELDFLSTVLTSGALLEDEHFPLAAKILRSFLGRQDADSTAWIVLNGLPRHIGQARAVDVLLRVLLVVYLDCPAETIGARIRDNVGGDRTGRTDDDPRAIGNKLAVFRERTLSLLDHYRQRGTRIETIRVAAGMTPEDMWEAIPLLYPGC